MAPRLDGGSKHYETSVSLYQTTQRSNPEDSRFHIRPRENLISHFEELLRLVKWPAVANSTDLLKGQ
jgi:hypothetical protein